MKQTTKLFLIAVAAGAFSAAGAHAKDTSSDVYPVSFRFGNSPPTVIFVKKPQTTVALSVHRARNGVVSRSCAAKVKPQLQADPHGGFRVLYVQQPCTQ
jgi:hypothetical protein